MWQGTEWLLGKQLLALGVWWAREAVPGCELPAYYLASWLCQADLSASTS